MKKIIVEFLGTFFLVGGAIFGGAIGASLALMAMVYAGGHISGAHYNPAVTVAMLIRRKIAAAEALGYFIAQLAGAAVAALIAYHIFEVQGAAVCGGFIGGMTKIGVAEVIGTFALAYVVLNVATARGTANNSFYGLAIAGTVLAMATAFGSFSGGVFNPAVGFGLCIQKSMCFSNLWLYVVAQIIGGALAAVVFLFVVGAEEEVESIPDDRTVQS